MFSIKGTLKRKGVVEQVSDTFKKRTFVVEDASGQYAQTIEFQAVQDRVELLDKIATGQPVEVTFFVRGREWTNPKDGSVRVFNTLDAWKVEALIDQKKTPVKNADNNAETNVAEGDDDLPF